jgi:hypothetical protein
VNRWERAAGCRVLRVISMRRLCLVGFALALGQLACASTAAAKVYDWTFTNASNVVEGHGTLTATTADGGGFDVTALSGFVNDPTVGVDGPVTSFTAGSGNDGVFVWDNVVYTLAPFVDNLGIVVDAGGQEINIYNATGGCCSVVYPGGFPLGETLAGSSNNTGGDHGTFSLVAIPEPATWAMMLLGAGMIGGGLRMARRKSDTAPTVA